MLSASTEYLLMLLSERIEADYLNSIMIDLSIFQSSFSHYDGFFSSLSLFLEYSPSGFPNKILHDLSRLLLFNGH